MTEPSDQYCPLTIAQLAKLPRWVAWQAEPESDPAKPPRKRPYSPHGGDAKANDPSTWGIRQDAEERAATLAQPIEIGGVGFELGDIGNGVSIGGIDLDTCRNNDSGAFAPWAAEVILKFSSYTEISPSRSGVKIFFVYATNDLPELQKAMSGNTGIVSGRKWCLPSETSHPPGIELYLAGRYFAVTDECLSSSTQEIKLVDKQTILWLITEAGPALIPAETAAERTARDNSRSAIAYRLGYKLKSQGRSFEEMRRVLRTDPSTAQWFKEKGDDRQLKRIWERTSAEPPLEEIITLNEWNAGLSTDQIPPRGWLLANTFCRGFVSALIADGGVGKTAMRIAQLMALASGKPITGQHIFKRCRVLFISLEDDEIELKRRILAAQIHHDITAHDLDGWFYAATPRGLKIAQTSNYGDPMLSTLNDGLRQTIERLHIDVVSLDPFVKSHGMEENANNAIDFVADALARIAIDLDIAVDSPHHISKGGGIAGDADKARGASAFKDAARLVYTLTPMSPAEAELFNVDDSQRRSYVRLDSAKVNIAPPSEKAQWFHLIGVSLNNATPEYPKGDEVQTIEPWEPPDAWGAMTPELEDRIIGRIERGLGDGRRYSAQAKTREDQRAWQVVCDAASVSEGQAKLIIKGWLERGALVEEIYRDPVERKDRKILRIAVEKRTIAGEAQV